LSQGKDTPWLERLWPYLAHVPVVAWLFAGALFEGQVFFFRDVSVYYYPNYVFLERSLEQGVWPLWNPTSDAGAPCLMADPVDLVLVGLFGATAALRLGPPLHLALAMVGASRLAGSLGMGRWGVWSAGLFYGLSGYVLSTANLFELFHATAWGPWVVEAARRLWDAPGPRRIAALALLGAVQVSTLGAETVLQTAVVSLVLVAGRPDRRRLLALAGAAVLAAALAAPALLGARALVQDTARAEGLPSRQSFAFSLPGAALLDTVLPRFFGNAHTFSEWGYWGQPFFPAGFPYLLSLYVGPGLLWLALRSSPTREKTWLVALCGLGILLALGRHGPLEALLGPLMRHFRTPPKFLFMSNLAVCVLAARGLDDACQGKWRSTWLALVPGVLLAALYPLLRATPELPARVLGGALPALLDPRAQYVIATAWPATFGTAGVLLLGAVVALRSRTSAPMAGLLLGLDLLIANGSVNVTATPSFYELRPAIRDLVTSARAEGVYRWFAYGAAQVAGLRFAPQVAERNADVSLYYVERQSLLPRTHVLDSLEGAFDEDRVGWAPRGAALGPRERVPSRYRQHHARLRLANVRFVVSFRPLPEDLVKLRGAAVLPEVLEPLRVYELRSPLPRAFRVGRHEIVSDAQERLRRLSVLDFDPLSVVLLETAPSAGLVPSHALSPARRPEGGHSLDSDGSGMGSEAVGYERLDPHTVRLIVPGPPGLVVVADGYHRDWLAESNGQRRRLLRANGRYWAIETAGGGETITIRYLPAWRPFAMTSCALGALVVLVLVLDPRSPGKSGRAEARAGAPSC
jgi:hypothetical protein